MLKTQLSKGAGYTSPGGIIPLSLFNGSYNNIPIVADKFVIPAGGAGYYIFNLTGYTNDVTITSISILKNNIAFTESTSGVGGAWTSISGMEYLVEGDTLHFSSVGSVGFNDGGSVFIGRLFQTLTTAYRTCNSAFRVATIDNTVLSATTYPLGSNTKTVYGTTADLPTNSTFQHFATDEVSILSLSYSLLGVGSNKGIQLGGTTPCGFRAVHFGYLTSADPGDFAALTFLCNQSVSTSTIGFYSAIPTAVVYAGSSLGFIKYT